MLLGCVIRIITNDSRIMNNAKKNLVFYPRRKSGSDFQQRLLEDCSFIQSFESSNQPNSDEIERKLRMLGLKTSHSESIADSRSSRADSPPPCSDSAGIRFFPSVSVYTDGTLCICLRGTYGVEITFQGGVRVCKKSEVAVTVGDGTVGVMHPQARIVLERDTLYAQIGREKLVCGCEDSLLMTMKRLRDCFFLSSSLGQPKSVFSNLIQFPVLSTDCTEDMLPRPAFQNEKTRKQIVWRAKNAVKNARFKTEANGTVAIRVLQFLVRQFPDETVEVVSPEGGSRVLITSEGNVSVHTELANIGIEKDDERIVVKTAKKSVFSSRKGLMISVAQDTLVMDAFGKLLTE